jgi:hypothetical protein
LFYYHTSLTSCSLSHLSCSLLLSPEDMQIERKKEKGNKSFFILSVSYFSKNSHWFPFLSHLSLSLSRSPSLSVYHLVCTYICFIFFLGREGAFLHWSASFFQQH